MPLSLAGLAGAALRDVGNSAPWVAYGPGIAVGLGASLFMVLDGGSAARLLLLVAAALLTISIGVRAGLQAPIVLGAITLMTLAVDHSLRSRPTCHAGSRSVPPGCCCSGWGHVRAQNDGVAATTATFVSSAESLHGPAFRLTRYPDPICWTSDTWRRTAERGRIDSVCDDVEDHAVLLPSERHKGGRGADENLLVVEVEPFRRLRTRRVLVLR